MSAQNLQNLMAEFRDIDSRFKAAEQQHGQALAEVRINKEQLDKIKEKLAAKGIHFDKLQDLQPIYDQKLREGADLAAMLKQQLQSLGF